MSSAPHVHPLQIYYEDTDLTGSVYHANYLAYFERAREHLLGVDELVRLYKEDGVGFVVHHAEVTFRAPCRHGDALHVLTTARSESDYRVVFDQRVRGVDEAADRVFGTVTLVCVDREHRLTTVPSSVRAEIARRFG
ncbi:MAG: thioesterase family protein [Myxococcota bacterium]